MKESLYNENSEAVLNILKKGAFLTTMLDDKINTMTIGWAHIGYSWGKEIFTIMVRKTRFTHELLAQTNEFTLTFPVEDMKSVHAVCGTKSGRDLDKIAASNLAIRDSLKIKTPILDLKGFHFECSILYKTDMSSMDLDDNIKNKWYADNNYHTLYFAEILSSYTIQ